MALVLLWTGTSESIIVYAGVGLSIFSMLAMSSIYILRWKRPDLPRPFRTPGYPVTPAVYLAMTALLTGGDILQPAPNLVLCAGEHPGRYPVRLPLAGRGAVGDGSGSRDRIRPFCLSLSRMAGKRGVPGTNSLCSISARLTHTTICWSLTCSLASEQRRQSSRRSREGLAGSSSHRASSRKGRITRGPTRSGRVHRATLVRRREPGAHRG